VQTTAPTVEGLTEDLLGFLTYLVKSAEVDVFRVAAELDLSLSQIRALFILDHAEHELALTELAPQLTLSVAATGRAIEDEDAYEDDPEARADPGEEEAA